MKDRLPKFDELMGPTIQALKRLGGSASIEELVPEIVKLLYLPQELADIPHKNKGRTKLEYRSYSNYGRGARVTHRGLGCVSTDPTSMRRPNTR